MVTVQRNDTPVDLVQHDDGVIDEWISSLLPEEFELLLERLDDRTGRIDVLREGADVLGWFGR